MGKRKSKKQEERFLGGGGDGIMSVLGRMTPTLAGPQITPANSLTISAVWQAVNIYANALGLLDFEVMRRDNGGKVPAYDHYAYRLVHDEPNDETTAINFRQAMMGHTLTHGISYIHILRKGWQPAALQLLDPRHVAPRRKMKNGSPTGKLYYHDRSSNLDIPNEDIIAIHGLSYDGITGYSPVDIGRESLGGVKATEETAQSIYGNGMQPSGAIEQTTPLNETANAKLREQLAAVHQGTTNAGKLMLLPFGTKWLQTSFSPENAEFIARSNFNIAEVARWFNLPQTMLGNLDHSTFSNIEELNIQFYQASLLPWIVVIEQEFNRKLFLPEERQTYSVQHNYESFLRGNTAARTSYYRELANIGVLSINEVRIKESLNPIPDGDKHLVQGAMIPIEQAGQFFDPATSVQNYTAVDSTPATDKPSPDHTATKETALPLARTVLADSLGRMVRREVTAVRKAAKTPSSVLDWCPHWYTAHRSILAQSIQSPIELIAVLTGHQLDHHQVAEDLVSESRERIEGLAKTVPPDELADALNRVCEEWEGIRTEQWLSRLIGREYGEKG